MVGKGKGRARGRVDYVSRGRKRGGGLAKKRKKVPTVELENICELHHLSMEGGFSRIFPEKRTKFRCWNETIRTIYKFSYPLAPRYTRSCSSRWPFTEDFGAG